VAGTGHSANPDAPKAFLNILLFDKNFNFVEGAYEQLDADAEQVGIETNAPHDYLMREVTVTEPGYAYIFLSNENQKQVDVHFDDVTITHTHSNIVAGADYYPFGLAMENREITAEPYRYGYQGKFSEKDLTTGMQEFELRMYDPRIGRWMSPDPYGQFTSPYVGMGNIGNITIDPDGAFAFDFGRALVVGTIGAIIGGTIDAATSDSDGTRGALIGFAAGFFGGGINWSGIRMPNIVLPEGSGRALLSAANQIATGVNTNVGTQILERAIRNAGGFEHRRANNNDVEIVVQRFLESDNSTTSRFNMRDPNGDNLTGYFLEPAGPSSTVEGSDRRISAGVYDIEHWNSPDHPNTFIILNVPGRSYVLIHVGNFPDDTEACFLPGVNYGTDNVSGSTIKMNEIRRFINNNPQTRIIMYLRDIHP
jgi:RHS repeat-associated protein